MITLLNLDFLKNNIPDESVDLVVTDPPYKLTSGGNTTGEMGGMFAIGTYDNSGKLFDVPEFELWIPEVYRVLKDGTHFYCMTDAKNMWEIKEVAEKCGFYFHNLLVWKKNTCTPNRWYMKNAEFTLLFKKGKQRYINDCGSKTCVEFPNPKDKLHPTQKPLELMKIYVENSSKKDDLVLDPFVGCGTTGLACKHLGRRFIGYETNVKYFKTAKRLLNS